MSTFSVDYSIKFQYLAIIVLLVILIDFIRSKKMPLMSTKVFGVFLGVSLFNLFTDLFSYTTLSNIAKLWELDLEWVNRLAHQLFIGSLDAVVFTLFMYVYFLSGAQKRMKPYVFGLFCLPFAVAVCFALFAKIQYVNDADGIYSYGPMVNVFFGSILMYVIAVFFVLFRKKNGYTSAGNQLSGVLDDFRHARISVAIGLGFWVVVTLVQALSRYWLISAMGVSIMPLYIYITFENPRGYYDMETDTLNRRAFHIMVPEMLARKKPFYMLNFTLDNVDQIQKVMGYEQAKRILRDGAKQLSAAMPCVKLYHSRSYTITAFITKKEQLDSLIAKSETWNFEFKVGDDRGTYSPHYHLSIIECPKYGAAVDEIYDTVDYCMKEFSQRESGKIYFVDDEIISSKNYRMQVLSVLTDAVRDKAFNVVYQPIYSNEKHRFASAEALVRLVDEKTLGFVSPEIFIPLAEERGLIGEIGNIVFEKVCSFAARTKIWNLGVDYIEVNLSGVQSVDISIVAQLTGYMQKYGVHPGFFNLEITETASIDGGDMLQYNMDRLRKLGCHFSMDDFGTGYSNLSQMAKVHFDLVKLDKSLIWPCYEENNEEAVIILNSCIDMINQLGVGIVAEGVETKEQVDMLSSKGVTYLQGYYFSKPVPEEQYINKVKEYYKG